VNALERLLRSSRVRPGELTPQILAQRLKSFTPEQLGAMDHSLLYSARGYAAPEQQDMISPFEHRAFAREATRENPLMALPIALATPIYAGAKALGLTRSRSGASLDQVGQGLRGVGEGLLGAMQDRMPSSIGEETLKRLLARYRGRSND